MSTVEYLSNHCGIGDMAVVSVMPEQFTLVTDSQEVKAIFDTLGIGHGEYGDYDACFVEVLDGEYGQVWGMCGIVPYLSKLVCRIH